MTDISKSTCLCVGNFKIKLWSKSNVNIGIDCGYSSFIVSKTENFIEIEIIPSIPEDIKREDSLVFETNDDKKKLWHVCSTNDGYKIIVYSPSRPNDIQQIAFINTHSKSWTIYSELITNNTIMPLSYPMGPLIMYYLTTTENAIMIHSSGIVDGGKGRLFSGFSGVGKSTMADIWQQNGNITINDDRLLLTIHNDKVIMHNTPMFYEDKPKSNQLNAIYLLKQTKEHTIRRLNDAEAISRLLAFCIQHGYDKTFLEHHLNTVFDIYNCIPIYELGFKLDADVIDFIRSND